MSNFTFYKSSRFQNSFVKAWDLGGKLLEPKTLAQAQETASLPFIHKWLALMPDAHFGCGATVGSVACLDGAVIPAAVGVDIGCGMSARRTSLTGKDIPMNLWPELRERIEKVIPHGRTEPLHMDKGSWGNPPDSILDRWELIPYNQNKSLSEWYGQIKVKHPRAVGRHVKHPTEHLGTLGSGNHFIELCLDEEDRIWVVVHSGSRGTGSAIGRYFTNIAKDECKKWFIDLPNPDLAFLPDKSELAKDYIFAMNWAQQYAKDNRDLMSLSAIDVLMDMRINKSEDYSFQTIDCHHNYMSRENHYNRNIWVVRKGAVRARVGDRCIIPGSMGARSFICEGLGNPESFNSCSHGAGRIMSRGEARRTISLDQHIKATEGVECIKDNSVIDESPAAYKNIDDVMAAQNDLVKPIHTLKQFICIKGTDKKK